MTESFLLAPLNDPCLLQEINNSAVPNVNEISFQKAGWLLDHAAYAALAVVNHQPAGVILVLGDDTGFDSDYYRWFTDRYRRFLYIDRVIVLPGARRLGIASAFYRAVDQLAEQRGLAVVSEVYCDPPNTISLDFHHKNGFIEVGRHDCPAEGMQVAKLMKHVERVLALV